MNKPDLNTAAFAPMAPPLPHRWVAMGFLLAGSFVATLDLSIVNVALPSLQTALQADGSQLEWLVAGYILAYALALLPMGRLGDIIGRRRLFAVGLSAFVLTSALCGLATSVTQLIGARLLQGLAAASFTPQIMAIAVHLFAPPERPRAFALFGLVGGIGSILGAVLGGLLIHAYGPDVGWRACFFINIPWGLLTLAGALRYVPVIAPHPGLRNDPVGIVLSTAAILCLIFPLVEGRGYGWPLWCFVSLAAALPLMAAFIAWERRQQRNAGPLLFPIHLHSNPDYLIGGAAIAVLFSALQGLFLIIGLVLQQGLQNSPAQTGMAMACYSIGIAGASLLHGRVPQLRAKAMAGALLMAAALGLLGWVAGHAEAGSGTGAFILPMLLGGIGSGMTIPVLFQGVSRTVPLKDIGTASGSLQVLQQLGAALGVALVSQLFYPYLAGGSGAAGYTGALQHSLLYLIPACLAVLLLVWRMPFRPPVMMPPRPVPGGAGPRGHA